MAIAATSALATEFHVATHGHDANRGTKKAPLHTIQRAADLAQPGDVITVHEGVYDTRAYPHNDGHQLDALTELAQGCPLLVSAKRPSLLVLTVGQGKLVLDRASWDEHIWRLAEFTDWQKAWLEDVQAAAPKLAGTQPAIFSGPLKDWFTAEKRLAMAITVHVSPSGSDANSGTEQSPFQSLTRARDAVRQTGGAEPRRIIVHGGAYYDVALALEPEDSGLSIEAAEGETPVLYGGRPLIGWREDGPNLYAVDLPAVQKGERDFRMLEVNGRFCFRGRLPMGGRFKNLSEFDVPWMSSTGGGWKRKPTEKELTTLIYRPEDLGPWLKTRNAELTIFHSWDESTVGVKSLDDATHTITFTTPAGSPAGAFGNHDFIVWNVREGMTIPGQWYLDREAGKVVYWPLPGEDMGQARVIAPTQERIIRITGTEARPVTGIILKGLTLAVMTTPPVAGGTAAGQVDGAISASQVRDCRFTGLTIRNVHGHGIRISNGAGLRIDHCEIAFTGAGGIVAGATATTVEQNLVHHVGLAYPSAAAIRIRGAQTLVWHNEVCDTSYTAILGGTRVEHNLIYMKVLNDGAAIYVFGAKEAVIHGNVVFGNGNRDGRPAHAYYLDERSENSLVEGNLAVEAGWPVHNHMAKNCTIRNNVFLDEGASHLTFQRCEGFVFEKNIVVGRKGICFSAPTGGIGSMPNNILFSRDGAISSERLEIYAGVEMKPLQPSDGTIIADPRIERDPSGQYRLGADSPAGKLGIVPLDLGDVGRSGFATKKFFISMRMDVIEPPRWSADGAIHPGQVRLSIDNLGDKTEQGTLDLWSLPSRNVHLDLQQARFFG